MENKEFNTLIVIGLTEYDAIEVLEDNGFSFVRTVERDGKLVNQSDKKNDEWFNLFVADDKVFKFSRG